MPLPFQSGWDSLVQCSTGSGAIVYIQLYITRTHSSHTHTPHTHTLSLTHTLSHTHSLSHTYLADMVPLGGGSLAQRPEASQCRCRGSVTHPGLELCLVALAEVDQQLCQSAQTHGQCLHTALQCSLVDLLIVMLCVCVCVHVCVCMCVCMFVFLCRCVFTRTRVCVCV